MFFPVFCVSGFPLTQSSFAMRIVHLPRLSSQNYRSQEALQEQEQRCLHTSPGLILANEEDVLWLPNQSCCREIARGDLKAPEQLVRRTHSHYSNTTETLLNPFPRTRFI